MLPPFCSLTRFPFCAVKASGDVMHLFLAGLFLLAVGSAGVKPSMASLGHEQFDETDEKENKQRPYFFTGFYISVNLGALISITLLTWIVTDYPWKWGFGLITTFAVTGVTSFLLGTPFYRSIHVCPSKVGVPIFNNTLVISFSICCSEDSCNLKFLPPGARQHDLLNFLCRPVALHNLQNVASTFKCEAIFRIESSPFSSYSFLDTFQFVATSGIRSRQEVL